MKMNHIIGNYFNLSIIILATFSVCLINCQAQSGIINADQEATLAAADNKTVCAFVTTKPTPVAHKYVFKTCIVAQMATYYSIDEGKYIDFGMGKVNENASVCENATDTKVTPKLVIDYPCGSLLFDINHTNDSKTFVNAIVGSYYLTQDGKEVPTAFANLTQMFFTTQSGHYYKCNTEQSVIMNINGSLVLSNLAIEAYRSTPTTEFYQIPEECLLDSQPVSDLVRIGVGICLIALVAIVLIAYFIGRRRWSERSSYESV